MFDLRKMISPNPPPGKGWDYKQITVSKMKCTDGFKVGTTSHNNSNVHQKCWPYVSESIDNVLQKALTNYKQQKALTALSKLSAVR